MCYGKMNPQNDFQNYRPITGCGRSLFVFNGNFNGEMARFWKVTAHTQLWVYNSENRFVGSLYHNTCCVNRAKRFFENNLFWDTLMDTVKWLNGKDLDFENGHQAFPCHHHHLHHFNHYHHHHYRYCHNCHHHLNNHVQRVHPHGHLLTR